MCEKVNHNEGGGHKTGGKGLGRLFVNAPAALLKASPEGRISVANRRASQVLARPEDALCALSLGDLVSPRVREEWLDLLCRSTASGNGYEGEIYLQKGDGKWFPANVSAVMDASESQLIISIADLTRQKEIEKRLYESKKLASLGQVVEGVAHEVRNPLASIGGFARRLKLGATLGEKEDGYLGIIISELARLEKMVADLEGYVTFARSRTKSFAQLDLAQLAQEVLAGFRAERSIPAALEIAFIKPPEPALIYGDRGLMADLMASLMENACEAMGEGGIMTVEVAKGDGSVSFRVKDTGCGLSEEALDQMMNPFVTSKTRGAGLGLAKAYLIVDDHEGRIDFSSEPGRGTLCTVTLPMDRRRGLRRPGN